MAEFVHDITVVHADDGAAWCEYLRRQFREDETHVRLGAVEVRAMDQARLEELESSIHSSHVVLLLVTSGFMTYMEDNAAWLSDTLSSRDTLLTTVLGVRLCVSEDEVVDMALKCCYDRDTWVEFELSEDGKNVVSLVTRALFLLDSNHVRLQRKVKLSKSLNSSVQIIPEMASQAGEKAAILFSREIRGQVTVHMNDPTSQPLTSTKVNPYCVTFNTPEIELESTVLHIKEDGEVVRTVTWLFGAPTVSSVELLCQAYDLSEVSDLDTTLARKFKDSHYSGVDSLTQDLLDNVTQESRNTRYPSLLHWSASYGLYDLTAAILATPSGNGLSQVRNMEGLTPAQMAEAQGHKELAEFVKDTLETLAFAQACALYVSRESLKKRDGPQDEYEKVMFHQVSTPPGRSRSDQEFPQRSALPSTPTTPTPRLQKANLPPPVPPRKNSGASATSPLSSPTADTRASAERTTTYLEPGSLFQEEEWTPSGPALGSMSLEELIVYGKAVKTGDMTVEEAERLLKAWKTRLGSGRNQSFKERQKKLDEFRKDYAPTLSSIREATTEANTLRALPSAIHGNVSPSPILSPISSTSPLKSPTSSDIPSSKPPDIPKRPASRKHLTLPTVRTRHDRTSDTSQLSTQSADSGFGADTSYYEDVDKLEVQSNRNSIADLFKQLSARPVETPPAIPPRTKQQPVVYSREKPIVKSSSKKKK